MRRGLDRLLTIVGKASLAHTREETIVGAHSAPTAGSEGSGSKPILEMSHDDDFFASVMIADDEQPNTDNSKTAFPEFPAEIPKKEELARWLDSWTSVGARALVCASPRGAPVP